MIMEGFLVIVTTEEVVSILVHEWLTTEVAWVFCYAGGHNREAELPLEKDGEVNVRESGVLLLAVVEVEWDGGVGAED